MRRIPLRFIASSFRFRPDRPIHQPNGSRLLIAALLLPMAACKVGPDFAAPAAPVAANWLESNDASVHTDRQDYEQWWTAFNDPTLNRLIDLAYTPLTR